MIMDSGKDIVVQDVLSIEEFVDDVVLKVLGPKEFFDVGWP